MLQTSSPLDERPAPSEAEDAAAALANRIKILKQRAERYARREDLDEDGDLVRLLFFSHGSSDYAIPLDDLREDETFVLFPDYLRRVAPNDSEIFDYDAWVRDGWSLKIGWQDVNAGLTARYPQMTGTIDPSSEALGFACSAGDVILFAGAQLHQTRPQLGDRTRYSLDFRLVDLDDVAAGRGAPNLDNRSRGSAVPDYVRGI